MRVAAMVMGLVGSFFGLYISILNVWSDAIFLVPAEEV